MKHGELIKKLRVERNFTQAELAHGISKRTTLTSFENHSDSINVKTLFLYLDRLNITLEEYMFMYSENNINSKQKIAQKLYSHDKKFFMDIYAKTNDFYYYYLYIQKCFIENPTSPPNDKFIVNVVYDHLMRVETWGHFEIALFSNCLTLFSEEYLTIVFDNAVKKINYFSKSPYFSNDLQKLLINALYVVYLYDYKIFKPILLDTIKKIENHTETTKLFVIVKALKSLDEYLYEYSDFSLNNLNKVKDILS